MMARSEKIARWLLLIAIIALVAVLFGGCAQEPPREVVKIVEIPSSKPYRFITFDPEKDSLPTIRQITKHNISHAAVKRKEKEAKTKAE